LTGTKGFHNLVDNLFDLTISCYQRKNGNLIRIKAQTREWQRSYHQTIPNVST
jgi:hypothetical protein